MKLLRPLIGLFAAAVLSSCGLVFDSGQPASTGPVVVGPQPTEEPEPAPNSAATGTEVEWPAVNHPQKMAASKINQQAPEIAIQEWVSNEASLAGQFVVIDFWATWCGPCRQMIPHMNALNKKYADQNITFLALSDESVAKVKSMKSPVIEYASAVDQKARLKKFFAPRGIPFVAILDPQGRVCWQGHPAYLKEKTLDRLLQAKAGS